jgi:cytochrome c oxidase assembly protein subunit 15
VLVGLLALQILLGAYVIWQLRDPYVTSAHVVVGALLLAVTVTLTWLAHRDVLEAGNSTA